MADWTIEFVDSPKYFKNFYSRAIAMDLNGFPHIAYGGDHLYHACYDGISWNYETVDPSSRVGEYASIALDPTGGVHISYYDFGNRNLKYATNASGTWEIYTLDEDGWVGWDTSIAVDPAGSVHISYRDYSNYDLKYATKEIIKPTAVCRDITIPLDSSGSASIIAADIDNGSSDNCGIASMSVNPNTFTCSDLGDNIVILTVTDISGNSDTCTATVTVQDNIPPEAKCKNISITLSSSGNVSITPEKINNGSSDNCGIASMNVSPSSFNSAGTYTVTLTVTDTSGNTDQCTATVTVKKRTSSQTSPSFPFAFGFNLPFSGFGFNTFGSGFNTFGLGFNSLGTGFSSFGSGFYTLMPSTFNTFGAGFNTLGSTFNTFGTGLNTFRPSSFSTFGSGLNTFGTGFNAFGTGFNALKLPSFNTFPGSIGLGSYNANRPF